MQIVLPANELVTQICHYTDKSRAEYATGDGLEQDGSANSL